MGAVIPMHTLHRRIHETIHDIPCPNEDVCEYVWHELEALRLGGAVDVKRDGLEQRITLLIQILREYDANLSATIATLNWQKQVVRKFYQGG